MYKMNYYFFDLLKVSKNKLLIFLTCLIRLKVCKITENKKSNYYYFLTNKKNFLSKHIIMVTLTTHKLRLIAKKRGIKNYKNMSREKLLSTFDESEHDFKNISQNGLERIAKMQNLSRNELEKIAKMRHIKNFKTMSKEGLLIALLKSGQSLAELYKSKSNNVEIEETRFSKSNIKEIRKNLYEKEKGLENEEQEKKQHAKELRKIKKNLKRLQEKENFKKNIMVKTIKIT